MMKTLFMLACFAPVAVCQLFVPVDGYNGVPVNDYLNVDGKGRLRTQGDPHDSFYTMPYKTDEDISLLSGGLSLGAETGDPLLNTFTDEQRYDNRDHRTLMFGEIRHPSLPLTAAVRYRYVDTYTDRFDSLWRRSASAGEAMYNTTKGVNYEGYGAVHWEGKVADVGVSVNPFGRWHVTPYFFSPLLEEGVRFERVLRVNATKRLAVESNHQMIRSRWYYDHVTAESFTDNVSDNRIAFTATAKTRVLLDMSYSSLVKPGVRLGGGGEYHDSVVHAGVNGSIYGNGEAGGSLFATSGQGAFRCSVSVAREYVAKEREYTFMENDTAVAWRTAAFKRTALLAFVEWSDPHAAALHASGWIYHTSLPLREKMDFTDDTVVIRVDRDRHMANTVGGIRLHALFTKAHVAASLEPALLLPFGRHNELPLSVTSMVDASFRLHSGGNNPASVSVSIRYNSAPELSYPVIDNGGQTSVHRFYGEERFSGYLSLRVPFVLMPLHCIMNSTAFTLDAGPLSFTGSSRPLLFPKGNHFGPEIFAGFEGSIW